LCDDIRALDLAHATLRLHVPPRVTRAVHSFSPWFHQPAAACGSCPPTVLTSTPSEHAFAKLKAFLRKARARSQDTLQTAIGAALDTITDKDARGWFKHCQFPLPAQSFLKLL